MAKNALQRIVRFLLLLQFFVNIHLETFDAKKIKHTFGAKQWARVLLTKNRISYGSGHEKLLSGIQFKEKEGKKPPTFFLKKKPETQKKPQLAFPPTPPGNTMPHGGSV